MARQIDGLSLGLIAAGGLLTYSGVKGYSIPHALQAFVKGRVPAGKIDYPISGSGGGDASGDAIAQDALTYVGDGYSWGGSLASGKPDCSGFANGVIGGDEGLAIPDNAAGTFSKTSHGPNTSRWLGWSGVTVISRAELSPGDIPCWPGHMGIAISNTQMVSALNGKLGVLVSQVDGSAGGSLKCLRLNALASAGAPLPSARQGPGGTKGDAANRALGKLLAASYGWGTGAQWTAVDNIAQSESGWSATVVNPSSGAAGIAQNIAGFGPGYAKGNASQQISWMLRYIKSRYGTPVAAWQFHVQNGYY